MAAQIEGEGVSLTANLDARTLLGHVLGLDDVQLVCSEHDFVSRDDLVKIDVLLSRRLAHEPVARILGIKEFYGLVFALNEATLVPRPETEMLVEAAIEFLDTVENPEFLELGVGTGCIAISILRYVSQAQAVGTDLSEEALACANNNAQTHGVAARIELLYGSWFEPVGAGKKYDLIVSNPPYIKAQVIGNLGKNVRKYDPDLALNGGKDGLNAYREIVGNAKKFLRENGKLLFEIGFDQGNAVIALCRDAGFAHVELTRDLAGQARMISAS